MATVIKTQLPALLLFARQWPHDSPEDIVQEAFMRLLEKLEPPENVTAWLFHCAQKPVEQPYSFRKTKKKTRDSKIVANFIMVCHAK